MLTLQQIQLAAARIAPYIRTTGLLDGNIAAAPGVRLKPENLQITGAFKIRGAANCIAQLSDEERARGVIAASAGNHAQGVAAAARAAGSAAVIVMPQSTPLVKVERTAAHGAEVILAGGDFDEAYAVARRVEQDRGLVFIHPFDDPRVVAGQGTIGLEILRQAPDVTGIVVPVGGGGLISGIATAIKLQAPHVKVFGVQTEMAAAMQCSFGRGELTVIPPQPTVAEGIAVGCPSEANLRTITRYVDDIVVVPEAEIATAMLRLVEDCKLVVEGAGAVVYAAAPILTDLLGERPVLVLSGGNVDVTTLGAVIDRGLALAGRSVRLLLDLPDVPGALARLAGILAQSRANILEIFHNRQTGEVVLGRAEVELVLSTRGPDHVAEIIDLLRAEGYNARQHHHG